MRYKRNWGWSVCFGMAALSVVGPLTIGCSLLVPDISFADPDDGGADAQPDGAVPDQPLTVVRRAPDDGAVDVAPDGTLTVEFSAPLDESSIAGSVELNLVAPSSVGLEVDLSLDATRRTLLIQPRDRMPVTALVEIVINDTIRGERRERLPNTERWSFSVRDGRWTEPVEVAVFQRGLDPGLSLAVVPSGTAHLAWQRSDGNGATSVWASRYDRTGCPCLSASGIAVTTSMIRRWQ